MVELLIKGGTLLVIFCENAIRHNAWSIVEMYLPINMPSRDLIGISKLYAVFRSNPSASVVPALHRKLRI
jgi:hypothetical protein